MCNPIATWRWVIKGASSESGIPQSVVTSIVHYRFQAGVKVHENAMLALHNC
jgi:hypothetical protein